jgi:hypothetical protein
VSPTLAIPFVPATKVPSVLVGHLEQLTAQQLQRNAQGRLTFANGHETPALTRTGFPEIVPVGNSVAAIHDDVIRLTDWIRSYFTTRSRLRKLRMEHARTVEHRGALVKTEPQTESQRPALALALRHVNLQISAVEHDIRRLGEEPPTRDRNDWML